MSYVRMYILNIPPSYTEYAGNKILMGEKSAARKLINVPEY